MATISISAGRRRYGPVSEPSCNACGYAVRGLPSFTCPECGSDLREVGIATPGVGTRLMLGANHVGTLVQGVLRGLWAVLRLGAPVKTFEAVVEVGADGALSFSPPITLPTSGRCRAVLVMREQQEPAPEPEPQAAPAVPDATAPEEATPR